MEVNHCGCWASREMTLFIDMNTIVIYQYLVFYDGWIASKLNWFDTCHKKPGLKMDNPSNGLLNGRTKR